MDKPLWTLVVDTTLSDHEMRRELHVSEHSALNALIADYAPGQGQRRSTIMDHLTEQGYVIYLDAWVEPMDVGEDDEAKVTKALAGIKAPQHDEDGWD